MRGVGDECLYGDGGSLRDASGDDMPIDLELEETTYLCRILHLWQEVDFTFEYRTLDLCCFKRHLDGFYFVKEADACR